MRKIKEEGKRVRNKKRGISLCLAVCMSVLPMLNSSNTVFAQNASDFDMSASAATEQEDWSGLRLDMKWAEEQETYGYWGTPLGNGLFAAKENGGVQEDVFVLNHSTFWSGDPVYRDFMYDVGNSGNTPEERAAGYTELVDTLKEAYAEDTSTRRRNELMQSLNGTTKKMWESDQQSAFLSAGRMRMKFPELTDTTDYKRTLDMDRAASEVAFKKDGVGYLRETFISNPDNVMVTRISNEEKRAMNMEVNLELPSEMKGKSKDNKVYVDKDNKEVVMTGRAPYDFRATQWDDNRGTMLETRVKVILPEGGKVTAGETSLQVSDAKEILVLYTSESSFKDVLTDPSHSGVDYSGKVRATLDQAAEMSYEELLNNHLEEYRALFRRFWIDMDGSDIQAADGKTYVSPQEYAMHYQYARYLNIACERSNSVLPHGLLGMWSTEWVGVNEGAYFLNENLEKTQALKGAANLADSSDGQYNLINSWAQDSTGQRTAQNIYGAEDGAWMMSHSTGLWAKSGMWEGEVEWGSWLAGGIWALDSLYDKYNYTQDRELLKKYYGLLEGAAKFALSTLIEVDGVDGELKGYKVVAPAGSPEHWYWVGDTKVGFDVASACDTTLYYNLFNMIEAGAKDLERAGISYDTDLVDRVSDAREHMMPLEMFIDEDTGRMREWYNEYPVGDERHRHASHLLGLFLSNMDINPDDTPELYEAQKKEMYRWMTANGGAHPDRTLMAVRTGYQDFGFSHLEVVGTDYGHDAVMKWTTLASSITEAIVDSRFDQINLMENLPSAWSSGTVKGIRARGGYQLSITWENGELVSCVINSPTGETPRVLYKGKPVVLSEDSRFTVNRADTSIQNLIYEAQDKLEGKYTGESKNVLQSALDDNDYDSISAALYSMVPVNYLEREVSVRAENDIHVLTEKGQTLQMTADSDKENTQYLWNIEAAGGGSAREIASIDENGVVTAISGGRVMVSASIDGEVRSKGSTELLVETASHELKESVDDRDSRMEYSDGWLTWDESKHRNGTITYSQNAGATAALRFKGTGFDFIGSSAEHIGNFKVTLDGEVIAENVKSGDKGYNAVLYSRRGLEDKEHNVIIEGLGDRIDLDAIDIYGNAAPATNRKALLAEYQKCREVLAGAADTEELGAEMELALAVINHFEAGQDEIDHAQSSLQSVRESLEGSGADINSLKLAVAMAEKLEQRQMDTGCYTEDSWLPVQEKLNSARALLEHAQITQEEADHAFLELITACNLLENNVQRVGLKAVIDGTEAILADTEALSHYTRESVDAVKAALAEARKVYTEESADQETVNAAARSLMDAVTSLLVTEENTRLDILIMKAEEILVNKEQYTETSVKNLETALEKAKTTAGNAKPSREEIDQAYEDLAQALTSLVRKAEKSELKNALDKADELLANTDKYVEDTIANLRTVAEEARAVYGKENADASEVGETVKRLVQEILKARLVGDVNMDGAVDSTDSAEVLQYAAEYKELTQEQHKAADVNGDGVSDSSDAAQILQYAAEIIVSFSGMHSPGN